MVWRQFQKKKKALSLNIICQMYKTIFTPLDNIIFRKSWRVYAAKTPFIITYVNAKQFMTTQQRSLPLFCPHTILFPIRPTVLKMSTLNLPWIPYSAFLFPIHIYSFPSLTLSNRYLSVSNYFLLCTFTTASMSKTSKWLAMRHQNGIYVSTTVSWKTKQVHIKSPGILMIVNNLSSGVKLEFQVSEQMFDVYQIWKKLSCASN